MEDIHIPEFPEPTPENWFMRAITGTTGIIAIVVLASLAILLSVVVEIQAHQRQHCVEQWAHDTVSRNQDIATAFLKRSDANALFDQSLINLLSDIPVIKSPAGEAKFSADLQTTLKNGAAFTALDTAYKNTLEQHPIVRVDLHC